MRLNLIMSDMM